MRLSPAQRADLAEALVPVAHELAWLARFGSPAEFHARLFDVAPAYYPALVTVLAAMVDVDRTPQQLLSWVTWEWDGAHPVSKPVETLG